MQDAEREGDFSVAMPRNAAVVNFLRDKNFHNLADLDNVDVIEGSAEFIDNHTFRVFPADGERVVRGDKVFISTGAVSVIPHITGFTITAGVFDSAGCARL